MGLSPGCPSFFAHDTELAQEVEEFTPLAGEKVFSKAFPSSFTK